MISTSVPEQKWMKEGSEKYTGKNGKCQSLQIKSFSGDHHYHYYYYLHIHYGFLNGHVYCASLIDFHVVKCV